MDIGLLDHQPQQHLDPEADPLPWSSVTAHALGLHTSPVQAASLQDAVVAKASLAQSPAKSAILDGLTWLGLFSDKPCRPRGTYWDTMCATLEERMQYGPGERDLVLLQHRFEVKLANGACETRTSTLIEYGIPDGVSAMAKTVGVPCGIAAMLVLDGVLSRAGVFAPLSRDVCDPIMDLLSKEGISMAEATL
ncbi:hypothetical protein BZG36_05304 [Bifiguratus adelaidae]|uniref:Saccharopine dehydrogenase-like C-terminal domain-containing protein n=1 Tax=Bifiguratus adelaidae TaxID=1938954 RepID=A0A261XU44_9FUNG|nr:hypothetical protein BZG36_05304 [Bifiguratus adelaidae]